LARERRRSWWLYGGLYLGLSLLLVQFHAELVNFGPRSQKRFQRHEQILVRRGEAPWTFRLAVPWAAELLSPVFEAAGLPHRRAVESAYLVWRWLFTLGLFLLFHRFLAHWLEPPYPLLGTLLLAALHAPSYLHYWFQPASALDLLLWTAALVLTLRGRHAWLFPLLLLGALNRETSVFIVLLHGGLQWGREPWRRLGLRLAALTVVWALPVALLRLWTGEVSWAHGSTPLGMLQANFNHPAWLLYAASFWGLLWAVPVLGWRRFPPELRRLALVLVPYLGLQLAFGRIRELRLLLPLGLVLVPMYLLLLRADEGEGA